MGSTGKKRTVTRPWRQDFRDVSALPDIKVVRTHFLLNLVAALFFVILLGLVLYQEYAISARRAELALVRDSIATASAADRKNLEASALFKREAAQVAEAVKFAGESIRPEVLLAELARARIPESNFERIQYVRVSATGSSDRHVSNFFRQGKLVADQRGAKKLFKDAVISKIVIDGTMAPSRGASAPDLIDGLVGRIREADFWGEVPHGVDLDSSSPARDTNTFGFSVVTEWVSREGEKK
jgi:hypothetical protein